MYGLACKFAFDHNDKPRLFLARAQARCYKKARFVPIGSPVPTDIFGTICERRSFKASNTIHPFAKVASAFALTIIYYILNTK
jgi:hypothetical protein